MSEANIYYKAVKVYKNTSDLIDYLKEFKLNDRESAEIIWHAIKTWVDMDGER